MADESEASLSGMAISILPVEDAFPLLELKWFRKLAMILGYSRWAPVPFEEVVLCVSNPLEKKRKEGTLSSRREGKVGGSEKIAKLARRLPSPYNGLYL